MHKENWSKVHFSDKSSFVYLGLMGNIKLIVKLGIDWTWKCVQKSVKVEEECYGLGMFWTAGVWSYIMLDGRLNAIFIRSSFSSIRFLLCIHHLISQQFFYAGQSASSHCKTAQLVLEAKNYNEMACPESWNKPVIFRKSSFNVAVC